MFLFTRRSRLSGSGPAGIEWATDVCSKVTEITGQDVRLWAATLSPGFGTITWSSWFKDLTSLEAVGDQLMADASYLELVAQGPEHLDGTLDDGVFQPLHGLPDTERDITYVGVTSAVIASGQATRAMAAGVELAMTADSITGRSSMFVRSLTGPYGSVGWLTSYASIAEVEEADHALSLDPGWIKTVDGTDGCWVESPELTQTTLHRRLV